MIQGTGKLGSQLGDWGSNEPPANWGEGTQGERQAIRGRHNAEGCKVWYKTCMVQDKIIP